MTIRPLQDRVIIKRLASEEKTAAGILIPDTAKEKPLQGRVVAVGSGKVLDDGHIQPCELKVGDLVLFTKYSGSEVDAEGTELVVLHESDVLGVVENAAAT